VPEGQKQKKWSVSQPGIESLSHCPRFKTLDNNVLNEMTQKVEPTDEMKRSRHNKQKKHAEE